MKANVLDKGFVEFKEAWGSDERIIEAARMSVEGGFVSWEPYEGHPKGDGGLLKYLYSNRHATPFEMAGMTVVIQAPIMVFREWHRHRTQCLSGETMIACVTPTGSTYKRSIRRIFDLKHGGVIDTAPTIHKNGYSKAGTAVFREARRKDAWRTRVLPNCQSRLLRVMDESSGDFLIGAMADVWESGVKEIFMLDTEQGFSVRASAEHPFYTQDGWVKMKDIRPGVRVARMGKVAARERPIPPSLRQGIGVWTTMMRGRLLKDVDYCYLCGQEFASKYLTLDHVVPVSVSLLTALDERNLKPACLKCHRAKTDVEQPSRIGMSKRGIRWEKVNSIPHLVGEEMTYDIEVDGPHHNYVANDLVVHNSYNEMSARYTSLPDVNYLPTPERCLSVSGTNKQAGAIKGSEEITHESVLEWLGELSEVYRQAELVYQSGLRRGIPKEVARLPVPVGRYSRMMASANLRNWLAFLTLRMDEKAQWEIRQFANEVGKLIAVKFPRTWEVYKLGA